MNSVISVFPQLKELSMQDQLLVRNLFTRQPVKKLTLLLREGQIENRILVIESGVFKHSRKSTDSEACVGLYRPGHIVSNYLSWLYGSPSRFKVEALTPGFVWEMTEASFQNLSSRPVLQNDLRRILAEQICTQSESNYLEMAMCQYTAARYEYLLYNEGYILKHTPLMHLADYLGVTQPTLSRIRRQVMEKEWNSKTAPEK